MQSTYERDLAGSSLVIPGMKGCQCSVQRGGRNLHQFRRFGPKQRGADRPVGIKLLPAPRGKARAGGHRRPAPRPRRAGGAWLVLKSTIRTSSGVTTSRSICPETSAGGRPGRSSRPTIETSARLPARKHRGKTRIGDQGQHAVRQRLALALAPVGGIAGEIFERGVAAALGGDIGQRLQQPMHQRAALQGAGALRMRFRRSGRGGLRPRPGSEGRSRLSAAASGGAERAQP